MLTSSNTPLDYQPQQLGLNAKPHYDFLLSVIINQYPLNHFNERPPNTNINTIIIHSMYAKDHARTTSASNCFKVLDENKVSSHYSIDRRGNIWQHVDVTKRAWHAGQSVLPATNKSELARENVNDFSIGIELIGVWGQRFRAKQYRSLIKLLRNLCSDLPISTITSHKSIAPERKQDPGPSFRWDKIKRAIVASRLKVRVLV